MHQNYEIELHRFCDQYELAINELVALLSAAYGYGDVEGLTREQRTELECEAEELAENWNEAEAKWRSPTVVTRLQAVLKAQHEIGERILSLEVERFRNLEL